MLMFLNIILLLSCEVLTELNPPKQIPLNQLMKVEFSRQYDFSLVNKGPTFQLIEIFSPYVFVNVYYSRGRFLSVLQANIFIPMNRTEPIQVQSIGDGSYFYYRVKDTMNIVPNSYSTYDFQMLAEKKNNWYTSIEFLPAKMFSKDWIVPMNYKIWIFPIFPDGQLTSWGTDYNDLNEDLIMSSINSSIDPMGLKKLGFVMKTLTSLYRSSKMQFTIANRKTYSHLVIIEVVFNDNLSLQYPPVIIYGCAFDKALSSLDKRTRDWSKGRRCNVFTDYTWKILIACLVGIIFILTLIGFAWENLLSLVFTWLVLSYIFCIGFHYTFWDINNAGKNLYYIICGICPGIAIFLSILNCAIFSTKFRPRIIPNVLCVVLIIYHLLWFIFQTSLTDFRVVLGVITGISIILCIPLFYFYELMITYGNVFISISVVLCGISLYGINSSSFPYLFMDFYNYILYRDSNVHYFTYVLYDDLLLFVSLGLSVIFMGCLSHRIYKGRNNKRTNPIKPSFSHQESFSCQQSFNHESGNLYSIEIPFDAPPPPYTPRVPAIELRNLYT